jgi:hypothetical protein
MPNRLDVAVQRKLIADLERDGRNTQEAEVCLQRMLEAMASFQHCGAEMDRLVKGRAPRDAREM